MSAARALIALAALLGVSCELSNRAKITYVVPERYVGWVEVQFDPSINRTVRSPARDDFTVRIPPSGILAISRPFEEGVAADEFYEDGAALRQLFIDTGGTGRSIRAMRIVGLTRNQKEVMAVRFFVGTSEELRSHPEPTLDEDFHPSKTGLHP